MSQVVEGEILDVRGSARGFERLGVAIALAGLAEKHTVVIESTHLAVLFQHPQRLAVCPCVPRLRVLSETQQVPTVLQVDVTPLKVPKLACASCRGKRE